MKREIIMDRIVFMCFALVTFIASAHPGNIKLEIGAELENAGGARPPTVSSDMSFEGGHRTDTPLRAKRNLLLLMPIDEKEGKNKDGDEAPRKSQKTKRCKTPNRSGRLSLALVKNKPIDDSRDVLKSTNLERFCDNNEKISEEYQIDKEEPLRLVSLKNPKSMLKSGLMSGSYKRGDSVADREENIILLKAIDENLKDKGYRLADPGKRPAEKSNGNQDNKCVCYCQEKNNPIVSLKKERPLAKDPWLSKNNPQNFQRKKTNYANIPRQLNGQRLPLFHPDVNRVSHYPFDSLAKMYKPNSYKNQKNPGSVPYVPLLYNVEPQLALYPTSSVEKKEPIRINLPLNSIVDESNYFVGQNPPIFPEYQDDFDDEPTALNQNQCSTVQQTRYNLPATSNADDPESIIGSRKEATGEPDLNVSQNNPAMEKGGESPINHPEGSEDETSFDSPFPDESTGYEAIEDPATSDEDEFDPEDYVTVPASGNEGEETAGAGNSEAFDDQSLNDDYSAANQTAGNILGKSKTFSQESSTDSGRGRSTTEHNSESTTAEDESSPAEVADSFATGERARNILAQCGAHPGQDLSLDTSASQSGTERSTETPEENYLPEIPVEESATLSADEDKQSPGESNEAEKLGQAMGKVIVSTELPTEDVTASSSPGPDFEEETEEVAGDDYATTTEDFLDATGEKEQLPFCDNTLLQRSIKTVINKFAASASDEVDENVDEAVVNSVGEHLLPEIVGVPNLKGILSLPQIENTIVDRVKDLVSKVTGTSRQRLQSNWVSNAIRNSLRHMMAGAPGSNELPPMTVEEHQFKNGAWSTHLVNLAPASSEGEGLSNLEKVQANVKSLLEDPAVTLQAARQPAVQNMIVQSVRKSLKPENTSCYESFDESKIRDVLRQLLGGAGKDDASAKEGDESVGMSEMLNVSEGTTERIPELFGCTEGEGLKEDPAASFESTTAYLGKARQLAPSGYPDEWSTTETPEVESKIESKTSVNSLRGQDESADGDALEAATGKMFATTETVVADARSDYTYLGKISVENKKNYSEDVESLQDADLFYVGDGVKLPLEIRKTKDGSYALSISRKVCEHMLNKKCPCCVPIEGTVVRSARKDPKETRRKRNSIDDPETISMPVKTFVKKYNLSLNLEHADEEGNGISKREENNADKNSFRDVSSAEQPRFTDGKSKELEDAPGNLIKTAPTKEYVRDDRGKNNQRAGFDHAAKYEYPTSNPILDRMKFIKEKQREGELYRYQRNADNPNQRAEVMTIVLNWLKGVFLNANQLAFTE